MNIDTHCDRCTARAVNRITLPNGHDLIFCQHHTNQHRAALTTLGAQTLALENAPIPAQVG